MANRVRKRKCKNCHVFFPPDPRSAWHQRYCSQPECKKASKAASKAASQQRWLEKEENRDHFRGPDNVRRVQEWRKAHPVYWRRKGPKEREPLQDVLSVEMVENPRMETCLEQGPLQEVLSSQPLVFIGLIAHLTGSVLQDDIAFSARRLRQLGSDILNGPTPSQGGSYDPKASHLPAAHPKGAQPVQLGGSPSGP